MKENCSSYFVLQEIIFGYKTYLENIKTKIYAFYTPNGHKSISLEAC